MVSARIILPRGLSIMSGRSDPITMYGTAAEKLFFEDKRLKE